MASWLCSRRVDMQARGEMGASRQDHAIRRGREEKNSPIKVTEPQKPLTASAKTTGYIYLATRSAAVEGHEANKHTTTDMLTILLPAMSALPSSLITSTLS